MSWRSQNSSVRESSDQNKQGDKAINTDKNLLNPVLSSGSFANLYNFAILNAD